MKVDNFKREFKVLNGVPIDKGWILFRKPLQLYNTDTQETVDFESLDDALHYEIDGITLEKRIGEWTKITFPTEYGGRGGSSGGFSGKWPSAGDKGPDNTTADLPARMNTKISVMRTYEDALKAFAAEHAGADIEHGVVVDAQGFITKYMHGNAGSISGLTGKNNEIAIHNHPKDGWPIFSKEDIINTALGSRRGIVAVSSTVGRSADTAKYAGAYTFVKGTHFNAEKLIKGINSANINGKNYNDAVNKWLKANQKKIRVHI